MCGRFSLTREEKEIIEAFNIEESHDSYEPSYNITPSQKTPIIYTHPIKDNTKRCICERAEV